MFRFDEDTRLEPRGDGVAQGRVSAGWSIGANPNGGYLTALAVAGLRAALPTHPDPLSVTVHFLRPGVQDTACELRAALVRSGRTLSTVRATLTQSGEDRLEILATMGELGDGGDAQLAIAPPRLPPPDACVPRSAAAQGVTLSILDRLDIRLDPDEAAAGAARRAQVTGWVRLRDGRAPDPLACLLFADAFPPAVFGLLGAVGWVPTVSLTVDLRRRPAPGWMRARFHCSDLVDGRLIEDGALWDAQGRLVAQSRQLALLRTPSSPA